MVYTISEGLTYIINLYSEMMKCITSLVKLNQNIRWVETEPECSMGRNVMGQFEQMEHNAKISSKQCEMKIRNFCGFLCYKLWVLKNNKMSIFFIAVKFLKV